MNVGWLFTGKKMDAWGPWNDKVKALSRKKIDLRFYTQQKYTSRMKAK